MSLPEIHRYRDLPHDAALAAGLDAVFFESSNTKTFESAAQRAVFRERWLGRYMAFYPDWFYVARDGRGAVAGYLAGALDDPASSPRFADIPYVSTFAPLTARFPGHLHVNLAPAYRGAGAGAALVERFAHDARAAGCPGMHVVTSRGARNVAFYARCGFAERGATGEGARSVVFLARALD